MADTDTNIPDEATATEGTTDKLHLNLHSIIDSSQKQHGILQNNYTNYRQALTRRLKRLTHNVEYKALVSKAAKEKALLAAAEDDKEEDDNIVSYETFKDFSSFPFSLASFSITILLDSSFISKTQ